MTAEHRTSGIGYRVVGSDGDIMALYVPEFRQIWVHPEYGVQLPQAALFEEFIHATQTSLRPAELLPLMNYLKGTYDLPGHEEFRDLVETVHIASHPLAFSKPVKVNQRLRSETPYAELGARCIQLACRLAHHRAEGGGSEAARREALWAIQLTLLNVVPRARDVGELVLDCLSRIEPEPRWKDARELLDVLLVFLSKLCQSDQRLATTFQVVRPYDSHQLLFRSVDAVDAIIQAPEARITATLPVLLSALTIDTWRALHVLRLKPCARSIQPSYEYWPLAGSSLRSVVKALRPDLDRVTRGGAGVACLAKQAQINIIEFLRKLHARRSDYSWCFLLHEMLELFPLILRRIILEQDLSQTSCPTCRETFSDPTFREHCHRLVVLSGGQKASLVERGADYGRWLQTDCLRLACRTLGISRRTRVRPPRFFKQDRPSKTRRSRAGYGFACSQGTVLAEFLPALGQIWIYPTCPDELGVMVESHELMHHNQCALSPSQLVPMRSFLLDRPGNDAARFEDIVEASYVVGLPLAADLAPRLKNFPPAPRRTRRLAASILRCARSLAKRADRSVATSRAEAEACRAVLQVLWHVVPGRPGTGFEIVRSLEATELPQGWHSFDELWPMLHLQWAKRLQNSGSNQPFILLSPIDPHRTVSEMLIFLGHVLMPIPERASAALQCFPVCMQLLTFGSLGGVPMIRVQQKGKAFRAEIEVLHGGQPAEEAIQRVVRVQRDQLAQLKAHGVECQCTRYFVEVLEATTPFRRSRSRRRLPDCLRDLLGRLDVAAFVRSNYTCHQCERNLQDRAVQDALQAIGALREKHGDRLVQIARSYEAWLTTGAVELLKLHVGLPDSMHVTKRFDYL